MMSFSFRKALAASLAAGITVLHASSAFAQSSQTATPIKHVVVIFQENVSFDHYFGTYPFAANPAGEPVFHARPGTPSVNGLSGALLTNNPNANNPANGTNAINPFRLDRSQAPTCAKVTIMVQSSRRLMGGRWTYSRQALVRAKAHSAPLPFSTEKTKGL
jgi:phospholipase C